MIPSRLRKANLRQMPTHDSALVGGRVDTKRIAIETQLKSVALKRNAGFLGTGDALVCADKNTVFSADIQFACSGDNRFRQRKDCGCRPQNSLMQFPLFFHGFPHRLSVMYMRGTAAAFNESEKRRGATGC